MKNDYKGFSLFNDVEDKALQNRNRAVILTNIMEQYTDKNKFTTPRGTALVVGYFDCIPQADRKDVLDQFEIQMIERNFVNVSA